MCRGGGGLRRAGGEEAWALSLVLVSLAFSSGRCTEVPETTGRGSLPVAIHSESPLSGPRPDRASLKPGPGHGTSCLLPRAAMS